MYIKNREDRKRKEEFVLDTRFSFDTGKYKKKK